MVHKAKLYMIKKYKLLAFSYHFRASLGILRWGNFLSHKLEVGERRSLAFYDILTIAYQGGGVIRSRV